MLKAIGSKYDICEDEKTREFYIIIKDLIEDDYVNQMKNYVHHINTTCFQHCINVAYYNYLLCKKLGLDKSAGARAGVLHDLFLYNWKANKRQKGEPYHAFVHGRIALQNAKSRFELSACEENIISCHMFPLSYDMPKYKESFIIAIVDKYCAIAEFSVYLYERSKNFFKCAFLRKVKDKSQKVS
jgi:uncharacterized protein